MSFRLRIVVLVFALGMAVLVVSVPLALVSTPREAAATRPQKRTRSERRPLPKVVQIAPKGVLAAQVALAEVGAPYVYGGSSPRGFDCSGLVRYAYGRVGVWLPHSSYLLYGAGRHVDRSQLRPGDLLFFDGLGHVGIYVGHGELVHAPHTGETVEIRRLAGGLAARLVGARRVVPTGRR